MNTSPKSRSELTRFNPITTWDAIRPPVAIQVTATAIGLTAE
jgi:hypothetical protein